MRTVRHACVMVVAVALTICACGGEPTRPRIDPQAARFDSLARVAIASGDLVRAIALSRIALAYQGGVTPATVTVQDSGVATVYRAAVLRDVFSGPPPRSWPDGPPDMWNVVFWQEPDAARFIHLQGQGDTVSFGVDSLTPPLGDSFPLSLGQVDWSAPGRRKRGDAGYATLAVRDSSGSCALDSASVTCTGATFAVALRWSSRRSGNSGPWTIPRRRTRSWRLHWCCRGST